MASESASFCSYPDQRAWLDVLALAKAKVTSGVKR
jgi:hypothetical protein